MRPLFFRWLCLVCLLICSNVFLGARLVNDTCLIFDRFQLCIQYPKIKNNDKVLFIVDGLGQNVLNIKELIPILNKFKDSFIIIYPKFNSFEEWMSDSINIENLTQQIITIFNNTKFISNQNTKICMGGFSLGGNYSFILI